MYTLIIYQKNSILTMCTEESHYDSMGHIYTHRKFREQYTMYAVMTSKAHAYQVLTIKNWITITQMHTLRLHLPQRKKRGCHQSSGSRLRLNKCRNVGLPCGQFCKSTRQEKNL